MEAKAYFLEKIPHSKKMVFIVASDDPKWCQNMFGTEEDMIMTNSTNSPGLDFAILSQCNHSIIRFVCLLLSIDRTFPIHLLFLKLTPKR